MRNKRIPMLMFLAVLMGIICFPMANADEFQPLDLPVIYLNIDGGAAERRSGEEFSSGGGEVVDLRKEHFARHTRGVA